MLKFKNNSRIMQGSSRGEIHSCKYRTRFSLKQKDFWGFADKTIGSSQKVYEIVLDLFAPLLKLHKDYNFVCSLHSLFSCADITASNDWKFVMFAMLFIF